MCSRSKLQFPRSINIAVNKSQFLSHNGLYKLEDLLHSFPCGLSRTEQDVYKRQHQNSADALVHALQFEAAKSASGWTSHKVRELKDRDGTDDEEKEQGTELSLIHISLEQR